MPSEGSPPGGNSSDAGVVTRRSTLRVVGSGIVLVAGGTAGATADSDAVGFERAHRTRYEQYEHEAGLDVYLYPRTEQQEAAVRSTIADAIEKGWSRLSPNALANPIERLDVWRYDGREHPESAVDHPEEYEDNEYLGRSLDDFENWRDRTVGDLAGAHLLVTDGSRMANAGAPANDFAGEGGSAFRSPADMIVGIDGSAGLAGNLAMQEVLHSVVDLYLDEVLELVEDPDADRPGDVNSMAEHSLGTVRERRGDVTPMATIYEGSDVRPDEPDHWWAEHGRCAGRIDRWEGTYTLTPTPCTRRAVSATASEELD